MQRQKFESGRTLLETLAVLVVIAILILGSITGYDFVIKKYREKETVKAVSELAVRYKLRPVKADEKFVQIKSVYPEAERASSVEMKTADTPAGRVQLQLFEDTSSFAVVVNQVLDTSCRKIIEEANYDMLVAGDQIDTDTATELNAYSRDYLLNDPEGQKIVERLCKGEGTSHNMKTVGLISGENCPTMGASYWYGGKCWNCASDRDQDNYGNCCAKGTVDVCGFCPGKCPNGGVCNTETKLCVECITDDQCAGRTDGKIKCHVPTNKCVECLNPGERCSGETEKYCMRNHTCQECDTTKHLFWNRELDICECASPLIAVGEACFDGCCVDGAFCHEGVCAACWLDYDPLNPGAEGMCPSERPLCQSGTCQGCPAKPTTAGAACYTLCGCDETKGLACDASGTCQCTVDPNKTIWNSDLGTCTECTPSHKEKCGAADCEPTTGTCCPTDKPVATNGHCCPANKPHWKEGVGCVECLSNDECPLSQFCNTSDGQYACEPCTGVTGGNAQYLQHVAGTTDRCECTGGFRLWCGSTSTSVSCLFGRTASVTCKGGCTQHPDCDENYFCSCVGRGCPAAGGTCQPCPADKPLRPKDSPEDCRAGQVCDCDLNSADCPASCCKGCDYKADPEHCPVSKCCNPAEDPETCPDTPQDPCAPCNENPNLPICKTGSCKCGECEEYVPYQGCVSKCAADEACVSYNKGTNTCGESQCIKVLPKDKLIIKKGTINGRTFYIPPSESKYRMTHASADRFCAHYGMHLARVMEACLKDFKYDSGHDCPNFAAWNAKTGKYLYTFTDRGNTYDLRNWNTSSSGDFWLAERDGNNALRVTHSCGNNHETNVCANIYPLCTE